MRRRIPGAKRRCNINTITEQPIEVDLREVPKRPFGVYVLVIILLMGVVSAALEIFRVHAELVGIWAEADEFLRDRSGLINLAARLSTNPGYITVINGIIIAVWTLLIVGLWLMQRWAWVLVMIFTGVTLIFALLRYFEGNPDYIGMLVNVAVAFYLNDRSVQRAYARRAPGGRQ